jgi:hypothetical protein
MGGCLSSGGGRSSKNGTSVAPKAPGKKNGTGDVSVGSRATAAAATTAVASAEDLKARARRRALQALVESLQRGEAVIPSATWRGQYLKTNGVGPAVISTIVNYIQSKSGTAAAATPSTAKANRGKHHIRTLDLRALRAGDDGFVEMMATLLDDMLVENVVFAGNEITDDGVRRLIKLIESRDGGGAAAADGVAASSLKVVLPCQLKFIGLTDNLISSRSIADFASAAAVFRSLEQLEVGRGQSGGGEDVDDVRDTLTLTDVKTISSYIQHTPSLATFLYKGTGNYYARTGFSPDGLSLFVDTVVGHSALRELYLQDCFSTKPAMIGPVTVQAPRGKVNATAAAEEPEESWSAEQILKSVQTLSTSLCLPSTKLSTLVLRFPLSDEAVQTLARGLAHAPHLANLSLRGCDMSGKALGYIGDALVDNRALVMLDVSYQSSTIAHPAYLAEMRSSSKRRFSYMSSGGTAYSAVEMARQDLSSGGSEVPWREERQHPLLHIIRSLHHNRTLVQLAMQGVNISTEDIEELCACIERSGNKTLSEVWYTTGGNDALKMKLEDFLAANREYGGGGIGGVGPSIVSSVRSSVIRISGSCANFFPDSTSLSDRSETMSRTTTDRVSTTRNTNNGIPYSPAPASPALPHHPPRPASAQNITNGTEKPSAERHLPPSLGNTTLNLKAGTAAPAANADLRSVRSAASPSEVTVSMNGDVNKSAISQRSRTLRFTNSEQSLGAQASGDRTDDAGTLPYSSQLPSARKARPS